jgi:hypothetical protein
MLIHQDSSELLEVLEVISMGHEPLTGTLEPGVMIGKTASGERVEMRIAASNLEDIYRAELRLDLFVMNTATGERRDFYLRAGIERSAELQPRLILELK